MRIADVVVPVVTGRPTGHRTLFQSVGESAVLCGLQQRNELFLEVTEILIHAVLLVAADESTYRVHTEQDCSVEELQQKLVLPAPQCRIVVQQVIEVGEVRN